MKQQLKLFTSAVFGFAFSASAAHAYIDRWQVSYDGGLPVASDCGDCEEELGIIIACTAKGQPAEVTVNAAAARNGRDGAPAQVSFNIDGQVFSKNATTVEFGLIGFTPVFQLPPNDPLIEAFQGGHIVSINFNGEQSFLKLNGSRAALDGFKQGCGWGGGGSGQIPQLPVFGQQGGTQQQPTQQQPTQQQPQLPVFGQQGGTQQQPTQPQAPQQPQNTQPQQPQTTVFGVEPGEAHTQPNQEGLLWYTSSYDRGTNEETNTLTYGIPETDAVSMIASCKKSAPGIIDTKLLINFGDARDAQLVNVNIAFDNGPNAPQNGFAFSNSSEFSGVLLPLKPDDAFWSQLSSANFLSVGVQGQPNIILPGAAHAAGHFISKCR